MKATIIYTGFLANGVNRATTDHFTAVTAWEFPVILKYTLPSSQFGGRTRPFLAVGPSFRTQEDASAVEPYQFGISAGVGATFQWGRFRIAPALCYTRWAQEFVYPRYATKPNQVELLTSVAYETESGSRRPAGHRLELGGVVGLPLTRGFQEDHLAVPSACQM